MTLDELIEAAWRDHAEQPEAVAARLADAIALVERSDDFARFVRVSTHVHGEHLGDWQRGAQLLESLRGRPAYDRAVAKAGPAVMRGIAALRVIGGEASALNGLSDEDSAYGLACAASALGARRQWDRAIDAFTQAVAKASPGLATDHPAVRELAVCGNNLSVALEGKDDQSVAERDAMVAAAEAGLKYWTLAGTWLEEERALYQLGRSLLRAGRLPAARASIDRCIDVCMRNDAPAFELFFGHAVKALVVRAEGDLAAFEAARRAALEQYALVADGERHWCQREIEEIGG